MHRNLMHRNLLDALREADYAIAGIKEAFGAPGDYGYETREGKALYSAYKTWIRIRKALDEHQDEHRDE